MQYTTYYNTQTTLNMRHKLLIFLLLFSIGVKAQTTNPTPTKFINGLGSDTYFNLPTQASPPTSPQLRVGSMYHNSVTGLYMKYNGSIWTSVAMTSQIADSLVNYYNKAKSDRKFLYPFNSQTSFGNSITQGSNATTIGRRYVNLIGSELGLTPRNRGLNSSQAADQQDSIYRQEVSNNSQLFTYMIGTNDNTQYRTDANKQANFKKFHAAGIVYLAIPDSSKFKGQSDSLTYAGTWTNSSYYGGVFSKKSTVNGSTATFKKYGNVIYIATTIENSNGGTFTVNIDGTIKGTFTSTGVGGADITTLLGKTYGSSLLRFGGLSNRIHNVVITVTSSTSASNGVYIDWVGSNTGNNAINAPTVIAGGTPRRVPGSIGIDSLVQVYSTMIKSNVVTYSNDGLKILYADVPSFINPVSDITSVGDFVHPNDLGHYHISRAFIAAINPQSRDFTQPLKSDTTNFYRNGLNSFGSNAEIGLRDVYGLNVKTGNITGIAIDNAQNVGIGSSANSAATFSISKKLTPSVSFGAYLGQAVSNTVTGNVVYASTFSNTDAGGAGVSLITHYRASQGTLSSAVTDQSGFEVSSTLNGAVNNYGFKSNLGVGANRWASYFNGGAAMYQSGTFQIGSTTAFGTSEILQVTGAGRTTGDFTAQGSIRANTNLRIDNIAAIGTVPTTGNVLLVGGNIGGAGTSVGISVSGAVQNGITNAWVNSTFPSLAASTVLTDFVHYRAGQGSIGSGASMINQYGFQVSGGLTGATNNFAFHNNISLGANRWGFYGANDVDNYFGGRLGLGITPSASLTLKAETSIAGSTPIKFAIPSAQTTTPEVGSFGSVVGGDRLSYVISTGSARKDLVLADVSLNSGLVPVTSTNGRLINSAVTSTEVGYVSGVTSAIQAQIDSKAAAANTVFTTRTVTSGYGLLGGGDLSANRTLAVDTTVIRTTANSRTLAQSQTASNLKANLAGGNTFTGTQTFSGVVNANAGILTTGIQGFNGVFTQNNQTMSLGSFSSTLSTNLITVAAKAFELPNASGTIALTSDLTGFVPTSRNIINGYGILGGGNLTADRTLRVDSSQFVTKNTYQKLTYSKYTSASWIFGTQPTFATGNPTTDVAIQSLNGRFGFLNAGFTFGASLGTSLLTANRIFELPDLAGTLALKSDVAIAGSYTGTGTATTTFTVTIGQTMANNTYKTNVTSTSILGAAAFYVSAKTTTTFDVTYMTGLTGTLTFDWVIVK